MEGEELRRHFLLLTQQTRPSLTGTTNMCNAKKQPKKKKKNGVSTLFLEFHLCRTALLFVRTSQTVQYVPHTQYFFSQSVTAWRRTVTEAFWVLHCARTAAWGRPSAGSCWCPTPRPSGPVGWQRGCWVGCYSPPPCWGPPSAPSPCSQNDTSFTHLKDTQHNSPGLIQVYRAMPPYAARSQLNTWICLPLTVSVS